MAGEKVDELVHKSEISMEIEMDYLTAAQTAWQSAVQMAAVMAVMRAGQSDSLMVGLSDDFSVCMWDGLMAEQKAVHLAYRAA